MRPPFSLCFVYVGTWVFRCVHRRTGKTSSREAEAVESAWRRASIRRRIDSGSGGIETAGGCGFVNPQHIVNMLESLYLPWEQTNYKSRKLSTARNRRK